MEVRLRSASGLDGALCRSGYPYQYPNQKLNDDGVIERGRQQQWLQRGEVHRELEGWPENWHRRHKCLYPPHLETDHVDDEVEQVQEGKVEFVGQEEC